MNMDMQDSKKTCKWEGNNSNKIESKQKKLILYFSAVGAQSSQHDIKQ